MNAIIGNAAIGGWAGFSLPALPLPIGDYRFSSFPPPQSRETRNFTGNSAHSTAFWWSAAGGIYVGGLLRYVNGTLQYNPGRASTFQDAVLGTGTRRARTVFNNTKVFLINGVGVQHWGNYPELIGLEVHDCMKAANVFGTAWITNMLVTGRTPRSMPSSGSGTGSMETAFKRSSVVVFQSYDTGQSHILSDVLFRNVTPTSGVKGQYVLPWQMLTHSDQFTPDVMIAAKKIQYDPPVFDNRLLITVTVNTSESTPTVSHRMQSWLDVDGTFSQSSGPSQIGSLRGGWWWKLDSTCISRPDWTMWICPMTPTRGAGSVFLSYDLVNQFTPVLGTSVCSNGNYKTIACPAVGTLSHLGYAGAPSMDLPLNAKLTGPTGGFGWVVGGMWKPPVVLNITGIQVDAMDKLVLVLPYPRGSRFSITMFANSNSWLERSSACVVKGRLCFWNFSSTTSAANVRNGAGDLYYFDDNTGHLYVRITASNGSSFDLGVWNAAQGTRVWGIQPLAGWTRSGISLPARGANYLRIVTDCGSAARDSTGAYCAESNGGAAPASPCAASVVLPLASYDNCGAGPGVSTGDSSTGSSALATAASSINVPLVAGCAAAGLVVLVIILVVVARSASGRARAQKDVASSSKVSASRGAANSWAPAVANPVSLVASRAKMQARWRRVVDEDDGAVFYENDEGETAWSVPAGGVIVDDEPSAAVPPAFRRVLDGGLIFYENVHTEEAVWTLPEGARLVN
jgi:hypothetical protein